MEAEAEAVIFLVGLLEAEAEAVKKSTASASLVLTISVKTTLPRSSNIHNSCYVL